MAHIAVWLLLVGAWAVPAQARTVTFGMPYLECFKTTENGEDEVYVVISGRWKNGQSLQSRFPSATGHWDLNDGQGDPPVQNQDLLRLEMTEGDEVDFVVMVLEEDGGTVGGWADLAGGALSFINAGAGSLVATIGNLFNIQDSDDFIGAVAVQIKVAGGDALATLRPLERVTNTWDASSFWTKRPVSMNGDGSSYEATFEVK